MSAITYLTCQSHHIVAMPFKVGAQTVMHGYAAGLSFDNDSRLVTEELLENVSERPKIRCFFRINYTAGIAALQTVDASGGENERIKQAVVPRFDGDPVFHALLGAPKGAEGEGVFAIEIEDHVQSEQRYECNTAILETTLHGKHGSARVRDFVPLFLMEGCPRAMD